MKIKPLILVAVLSLSMSACAQGPQSSMTPTVVAAQPAAAASHARTKQDAGDTGGIIIDPGSCDVDCMAALAGDGCSACSGDSGDPNAGGGTTGSGSSTPAPKIVCGTYGSPNGTLTVWGCNQSVQCQSDYQKDLAMGAQLAQSRIVLGASVGASPGIIVGALFAPPAAPILAWLTSIGVTPTITGATLGIGTISALTLPWMSMTPADAVAVQKTASALQGDEITNGCITQTAPTVMSVTRKAP